MHFSSAIAIAILAALPPVTVGSSVLDARQNAVTCQTSDASPTTEDVTQLIGVINTQPGDCSNKNGKVSGIQMTQSVSPPTTTRIINSTG